MQISSAAILTLTTLAAGNVAENAIAAPNIASPTGAQKASNIVVGIAEDTPAKAIATPESDTVQQFSQNTAGVQSGNSNKFVVIGTGGEGATGVGTSFVASSASPVGTVVEYSASTAKSAKPAANNTVNKKVTAATNSSKTVATSSPVSPAVGTVVEFSTSSTSTASAKPAVNNTVNNKVTATTNSGQVVEFSASSASAKVEPAKPAVNDKVTTKQGNNQKNPVVVLPPSPTPPLSPSSRPSTPTTSNDLVVTATDVQVVGASEELQQIIRQVIKTQAGGETSQSQLQKDVAAILSTGLFTTARVNSSNTSGGLSVVYQVEPVVVRSLKLSGAKILSYQVARETFQSQIGNAISPAGLEQAVQKINKWYSDNGYKLGRVVSITPNREGNLTLNVAEGLVGDIKFRFVNEEGSTVDSKGKPVAGRTKPDFLRQQLQLKPGQAFREDVVRQDVQQLYKLGLFESVNLALEGDANDTGKVDVIYELKEAGARSVNVGGNYSADQGIVGTLNYQDRNIGGVNDTLSANVEVGRRDLQFDTKLSSPYRSNNPDRLGYSISVFRKRGISETFDGDIKLANGDRIREGKVGGSISFQRPIDGWDTSLGFNYTRTSIRDRDGKITPNDEKGNPLTFSGDGIDDLATVSFTAVKDWRNNPFNPTKGSILSLSTEQSVPFGQGNISMNRLRANYSQFVPVKLFDSKVPQVFAMNLQAGTVLGDLPPYEAFSLGGPNSVRGYGSGDVASGRSYVLASAEYRFPILQQTLGGVLFADFASDLGSGDTVLGNPAGVRGKPGIGFGYGAGVRFDSPLGLLRADYGINDQGESRLHFGIGQRF